MVDKWHWYKFSTEFLGFHISIILQMLHIHIRLPRTVHLINSWHGREIKREISGGSGVVKCNVLHTDYWRQLEMTAKFINTRMFCSCYCMWINSGSHACTRTAFLKWVGKRIRSQSSMVTLHWYLFCYCMRFIKWKNIVWNVLILVCEWRRVNEFLFSISCIVGLNVSL